MLIDLECFPSDQVAGVGVCLAPGFFESSVKQGIVSEQVTLKLLVTYKPVRVA